LRSDSIEIDDDYIINSCGKNKEKKNLQVLAFRKSNSSIEIKKNGSQTQFKKGP